MNRWILPALAMSLGLSATAQTNSAIPALPPTTVADDARYQSNPHILDDCKARLAEFTGKPCDIIFIGDSISARWLRAGQAVWNKTYAPRHALNFGIDGDTTQNVLWRLRNLPVQGLKPKVAVLMIGTNDGNDYTSPQIADGVKAALAETEKTFPGAKIILVSLLPNQYFPDKMNAADAIIRKYADDRTVCFLDLVPLMPPFATVRDGKPATNWKGLGDDALHPDAGGYQMWADAMEPLLGKLLR